MEALTDTAVKQQDGQADQRGVPEVVQRGEKTQLSLWKQCGILSDSDTIPRCEVFLKHIVASSAAPRAFFHLSGGEAKPVTDSTVAAAWGTGSAAAASARSPFT